MKQTITELDVDQEATIVEIAGGHDFAERLRSLGIKEAKIVRVAAKHPFGGPMVLEVDGRQTTVGRGMARKIMVETNR